MINYEAPTETPMEGIEAASPAYSDESMNGGNGESSQDSKFDEDWF